jgi:hypothetical protein
MTNNSSRSHVSVPNFGLEPISDEDLIRGFLLDLGTSGRSEKTIFIYGDSAPSALGVRPEYGLPAAGDDDAGTCPALAYLAA